MLNLMPFLLLALYLFRKMLRFPRYITAIFVGVMAVIQIALGYLTAFFYVSSEAMSIISTVVYAAFFFFIVKDNVGRLCFVLLVLANLGNLVSICAKCMEGMIFKDMAFQNYRWSMVLCMVVVHLLITLPVTLYIRKYLTSRISIQNRYWSYIWLIPAAFYVIWYYHLYFAGHSSIEIAMDLRHAVFLLIINFGAFVVYHSAMLLLAAQDENEKLTQKNYLLSLQNIQYDNLYQRIDEARRAKHDVHHHAHLTLEYLRSGKLAELEAYLEQYSASLPDMQTSVYCENYEANTLLNHFAHQAHKYGIEMDIFVQFPQDIALPETTLSVLLGNLLENAIDACKEISDGEKKITVRCKASNGFVYLDISNNYTGTLNKTKSGIYLTTKESGNGLGLKSVSQLIKLHDGIFEVDVKDNVFRASVMLLEKPIE